MGYDDGMAEPMSIGKVRFRGAYTTAGVFKFLAWLTIVGGVIALLAGASTTEDSIDSNAASTIYIAIVAVSTAVTAALFAFFAYVLEILVEVYEQTWHIRFAEVRDEHEDDEGE